MPKFIGTILPSTHLHFHEDGSLIIGTTTGKVEIWDVGSMSLIGGFQARGSKCMRRPKWKTSRTFIDHLRVVTSISHGRSTFNILLETSAGLEVLKSKVPLDFPLIHCSLNMLSYSVNRSAREVRSNKTLEPPQLLILHKHRRNASLRSRWSPHSCPICLPLTDLSTTLQFEPGIPERLRT